MTLNQVISVVGIDLTCALRAALRKSPVMIERPPGIDSESNSQSLSSSIPPPTTHTTPSYLPLTHQNEKLDNTFAIIHKMLKSQNLSRNHFPHVNILNNSNLQMIQLHIPPSTRILNNRHLVLLLSRRRLYSTPIPFPSCLLLCLCHCYSQSFDTQMGKPSFENATRLGCFEGLVGFCGWWRHEFRRWFVGERVLACFALGCEGRTERSVARGGLDWNWFSCKEVKLQPKKSQLISLKSGD